MIGIQSTGLDQLPFGICKKIVAQAPIGQRQMRVDLRLVYVLPAIFIRFLERSTSKHDAPVCNLHLPACSSDDVPIGSARNLPGQHAAILQHQKAGFAVVYRPRSATRRLFSAYIIQRQCARKKKAGEDRGDGSKTAHCGGG